MAGIKNMGILASPVGSTPEKRNQMQDPPVRLTESNRRP